MLSKVTHSFVYELVKEVVSKFVTLAILEETLAKYQSMVSGQIKISELCIKCRLPHLAPGCKFSLGARSELEKMEKEHNLAYVSKLKDDLENKVIPGLEAEIDMALDFARRKLDSECPEEELHKARLLFEAEMEKKRLKRAELLRQKRGSGAGPKKRQQQQQDGPVQRKPRQTAPPPPWGWGNGPHQQWGQEQQQFVDPHVKVGWRNPRGRGRERGRGF